MNFNWPPITRHSTVLMSAGEAHDLAEGLGPPEDAYNFNLGEANVYVTNVSPHDGGVEFILHVDWPDPLNIIVDISGFERAEVFHCEMG